MKFSFISNLFRNLQTDEIIIRPSTIQRSLKKVPESDFINGRFDVQNSTPLKKILFLLSSPRSGSTLLSSLINQEGLCLPHEYFQKWQYVPILADRWRCISNTRLNKQKFVENLIKNRTSSIGWLGINLHGHHIPYFKNFEKFFPPTDCQFLVLRRKDIIAQAVSYALARQTKSWTTDFSTNKTPEYSFDLILDSIIKISKINVHIDAFIKNANINYKEIFYEEMIKYPREILMANLTEINKINSPIIENKHTKDHSPKKQSSKINVEWISRFSKEYSGKNL